MFQRVVYKKDGVVCNVYTPNMKIGMVASTVNLFYTSMITVSWVIFEKECSKLTNLHETNTRSLFVHARKIIESRSRCLVRLSSVFCKNRPETLTREEKVDLALFWACANVALVSILSIIAFFIIFMKSEYVTFSMVRAPHPFSDAQITLFL